MAKETANEPTPYASPSFHRERELALFGYKRIVGVDEAGRGPLAGPVVAAAAIVPFDFHSPLFCRLNDSKQIGHELRESLFEELAPALEHGIGVVHQDEIDRINIRQASWLAMQHAVNDLCAKSEAAARPAKKSKARVRPDFVLIDGLPYGPGPWPYEAIVKGDALSISIAAASVFAKVTRDRMMVAYDGQYPGYGFASHKGYGSPEHLDALDKLGPCELHRKTYAPVSRLLGNGQVIPPDE